ncbi:MAG: hypothetical protein NTX97_06560 [Bacteroidetes bacterium]|nr:hypothetical protein [Bacteroidota bacterium]
MKTILKMRLLIAGVVLSFTLCAQDANKKVEAPKTNTTKSDSKVTKQDPAKKSTANEASKSTSKADSTSTGGTRMAISVQGTPKKNKNKNTKSATTTEPPKK